MSIADDVFDTARSPLATAKVLAILSESASSEIAFQIPGASLSSGMLTDVRNRIAALRTRVAFRHRGVEGFEADTAAMHDPDRDTLFVTLDTGTYSRSAVVQSPCARQATRWTRYVSFNDSRGSTFAKYRLSATQSWRV